MIKKYKLDVVFTEPMLASSPANKDVYSEYIAARGRVDAEERGDEVATLPAEEIEKIGSSVFHRDEKGIFIFDYKMRGFLKEASTAMTGKAEKVEKPKKGEEAKVEVAPKPVESNAGMSAAKSKIDKFCFVFPRRLYLLNPDSGEHVTEPHESIQRPIRAMTAQGPRVTLKKSEAVKIGTHFTAEFHVLPLGQREITGDRLRTWLDYGFYSGVGEWRTGSYGRFSYTLEEVK